MTYSNSKNLLHFFSFRKFFINITLGIFFTLVTTLRLEPGLLALAFSRDLFIISLHKNFLTQGFLFPQNFVCFIGA